MPDGNFVTDPVAKAREQRNLFGQGNRCVAKELGVQIVTAAQENFSIAWSNDVLRIASLRDVYGVLQAADTNIRGLDTLPDNRLPAFEIKLDTKCREVTKGLFAGECQRLAMLYQGDWKKSTIRSKQAIPVVVAVLDVEDRLVCVTCVTLTKVKTDMYLTNLLRTHTGGVSQPMRLAKQADIKEALVKALTFGRLPNTADWRTND